MAKRLIDVARCRSRRVKFQTFMAEKMVSVVLQADTKNTSDPEEFQFEMLRKLSNLEQQSGIADTAPQKKINF